MITYSEPCPSYHHSYNRTPFAKLILAALYLLLTIPASLIADQGADHGKDPVGRLKATLYIGTDGDVSQLGANLSKLDAAMTTKLSNMAKMKFKNYRKLGSDTQSVLRSYENWLTPLNPSKQILLSYESKGEVCKDCLKLDLQLWQQNRKIMKTDQALTVGKPLYIRGPKWRGGQLIIEVELVALIESKTKQ